MFCPEAVINFTVPRLLFLLESSGNTDFANFMYYILTTVCAVMLIFPLLWSRAVLECQLNTDPLMFWSC